MTVFFIHSQMPARFDRTLALFIHVLETRYPSGTGLGEQRLVLLVVRLRSLCRLKLHKDGHKTNYLSRRLSDYAFVHLNPSCPRLCTRRTTRRITRRTKRCLLKLVPDGYCISNIKKGHPTMAISYSLLFSDAN